MDHSFDAVIVAAGQAASLARRLTEAGWTVALVEKKWLGGNCVNAGCTPTKAMVIVAANLIDGGSRRATARQPVRAVRAHSSDGG